MDTNSTNDTTTTGQAPVQPQLQDSQQLVVPPTTLPVFGPMASRSAPPPLPPVQMPDVGNLKADLSPPLLPPQIAPVISPVPQPLPPVSVDVAEVKPVSIPIDVMGGTVNTEVTPPIEVKPGLSDVPSVPVAPYVPSVSAPMAEKAIEPVVIPTSIPNASSEIGKPVTGLGAEVPSPIAPPIFTPPIAAPMVPLAPQPVISSAMDLLPPQSAAISAQPPVAPPQKLAPLPHKPFGIGKIILILALVIILAIAGLAIASVSCIGPNLGKYVKQLECKTTATVNSTATNSVDNPTGATLLTTSTPEAVITSVPTTTDSATAPL